MRRGWTRWLRLLAGAAILATLGLRLGSEPVLAGLRATTAPPLGAALVVTAATTWCCARRWRLVAAGLGAPAPDGANASYYRSQLVNATLPLGVVGDVDRGVRHGLRPVVWERGLGQLTQSGLAVGLLVLLPSAVGWTAAVIAAVMTGCGLLAVLVARRQARLLFLSPGLLARVALLSLVASAGHLLVFVVAARTAGVDVPVAELLPLGALVLAGSSVPTSVAGWGPREGVAAWAFAAVGLGAGTGLTVAVTYGVMSLVATLPGLLPLLRPTRPAAYPTLRERPGEQVAVARG